MIVFVGLMVLAALVACPITWFAIFWKWRTDGEPVPYEPRRPVPWDGATTLIIAVLYLTAQFGTALIAGRVYQQETGVRLDAEEAARDPRLFLRALQANVAAAAITFLFGLAVLNFRSRADRDDLGFAMRDDDLRRGLLGFAAIVPPVLLLNAALSQILGKSQHPLIEGWRDGGSPQLLVWSILTAVVAAPLVEEFLFRGVLQGWLERLVARPVESPVDLGTVTVDELVAPEEPIVAASPAKPGWMPVVISSVAFSLAHLGNGPDPIPIFFLALGLGYLYRQTHRLWPGIFVHGLLNAFSTAVLVSGIE
jgi:membrane protease YdiL (CAAX protease family)